MRKLLNTLYVTNPDIYLSKENETVVAKLDDRILMKIPIINLEGIVCFNRMGASPYLMELCMRHQVGLCFLTPHGHFLARLNGVVNGNVLLRRRQYRQADDEAQAIQWARYMIAGKIYNSRKVVERFKRDYGGRRDMKEVEEASRQLNSYRLRVLKAQTCEEIRALEGDAAATYFSVFEQMVVAQQTDFSFSGRNRRPPKDRVNCLLSFVYTLLVHEVQSALETVGLDPYVGFLHTDRPGRASLALDMMEEFRTFLGDRFVLSLINRTQLTAHDFLENGAENFLITDNGKKKLLASWQQRKKEELLHLYLNERVPIGLLPYIQAQLLARCVRGDLGKYPVFLMQ